MAQSVICIWDGWAFVWQEGLRNRSCWQHVGAELRAGRMAWITEGDREVTTAHCVSPWWAEGVSLLPGLGMQVCSAIFYIMEETFLYCLMECMLSLSWGYLQSWVTTEHSYSLLLLMGRRCWTGGATASRDQIHKDRLWLWLRLNQQSDFRLASHLICHTKPSISNSPVIYIKYKIQTGQF